MKKKITLILSLLLFLVSTSIVHANDERADAWNYINELQGLSENGDVKKGQKVTRAEAAYILAQLTNDSPRLTTKFSDVQEDHPYYKEIIQLAELGIFTGYKDNTFHPDSPLTRAQMAKILVLFFNLENDANGQTFKDVKPNTWFYNYIENLYTLNITTGTTATTFSPSAYVTRQQFALFLYRIKLLQPSTNSLTDYHIVAGQKGYGYIDGEASKAYFRSPQGIAKWNGKYIIADTENHMLRTLEGNTVNTLTGNGFFYAGSTSPVSILNNGSLDEALFQNPTNIVVTKDNSLLVADSGNHVIRKISPEGIVSTYAGTGKPGLEDGLASQAKFYMPQGLALADDGTLYVADTLNHVIRKISTDGTVSTLTNRELRAVKITNDYSEVAGSYLDGAIELAKFNEPTALLLDKKGNLFVSDSGNHVIRYIDFSKNAVTTYAGQYIENGVYGKSGMQDGSVSVAQFNYPKGLAILSTGEVLVADSGNNAIRAISNQQVSTLSTTDKQPSALFIEDDTLLVIQSSSGQIGQYTITH